MKNCKNNIAFDLKKNVLITIKIHIRKIVRTTWYKLSIRSFNLNTSFCSRPQLISITRLCFLSKQLHY